jgi:hypothetical protein
LDEITSSVEYKPDEPKINSDNLVSEKGESNADFNLNSAFDLNQAVTEEPIGL